MKNHTISNYIDLKICLWHNFEMSKFPLYALSGYNKVLGIFYKRFVARKAMGIIMTKKEKTIKGVKITVCDSCDCSGNCGCTVFSVNG